MPEAYPAGHDKELSLPPVSGGVHAVYTSEPNCETKTREKAPMRAHALLGAVIPIDGSRCSGLSLSTSRIAHPHVIF